MKTLLIATNNPAKFHEISSLLSDLSLRLVSLKDLGITEEVVEDGRDYYENSRKKAVFYANLSGLPTIADDGGLEIVALGGAPGVKSRRWLGYEASDEELIKHLTKVAQKLSDDNRTAYFKTVITLAFPDGTYFQKYGEIEGIIAKKPLLKTLKGYPYRSFFYLPKLKKYYYESELKDEKEKKYNHRYKAIEKIKPHLRKYFGIIRL